jgi:hypothetical protein
MGIFIDPLFSPNMGTQFETPFESMYMGAGWSQNQAYMSPAYMGNFRPQYGGDQGFSPNNIPGFSMTGAASSLFQGSSPYYVSPLAYKDAAVDKLTTAPASAAMWGVQNLALPIAAFSAAASISSMNMPNFFSQTGAQAMAGRVGAEAMRGPGMLKAWLRTNVTGTMSSQAFGRYASMSARRAGIQAGQQSFGAFVGGQAGRFAGGGFGTMAGGAVGTGVGGLGKLFGVGTFGGGAATGARVGGAVLSSIGGGVGALAGSIGMPFAMAYAGMEAAQAGIIDPYIASHRGTQAARANFANEYTGSSPFGTRGMGRGMAANVGGALIGAGTEDRAFGLEGGINVFDMSMTSGLMSAGANIDPEDIKKKVKNISKQVQALMAVAGDPDVRRAIERLAEMKRMGIAGADAQTTIQALGAASAISGKSALQIQGTVGAQASYLFQQAGITGQGAQQAAASSFAGFSNAYKMGLINPTQLALMGGHEGATQSLLSGQIGLARSMYNQIGLTNRFMHGQQGSDVVSSLGIFGSNVSLNPVASFGAMRMNSAAMMGAQLQENPLAPTKGIFDMLGLSPSELTRGKGGNYRWDAFSGAALQLGMGEDQVRALLEQMKGMQAPGAKERMQRASAAAGREQHASFLDSSGLDFTQGDGIISSMGMGFHNLGIAGSRIQREVGGSYSRASATVGGIVDVGVGKLLGTYGRDSSRVKKGSMDNYLSTGKAVMTQVNLTADGEWTSGIGKFVQDFGSTEQLIKKVERSLNAAGMSAADFDKIMALPMNERVDALKGLDLSEKEARHLMRVGPSASEKENIFTTDLDDLLTSVADRTAMVAHHRKTGKNYGYKKPDMLTGTTSESRMAKTSVLYSLTGEGREDYIKNAFVDKDKETDTTLFKKEIFAQLVGKDVKDLTYEDAMAISDNTAIQDIIGDELSKKFGADPFLRSVLDAAGDDPLSLGDPKKQRRILREAEGRVSIAGSIGIDRIKLGTMDEYKKLSAMEQAAFQNQEQVTKMLETGKLDFTGYMGATSANKMDLAAGRFSEAVNLFVKGVERKTGQSINPQLSEEGSSSWQNVVDSVSNWNSKSGFIPGLK